GPRHRARRDRTDRRQRARAGRAFARRHAVDPHAQPSFERRLRADRSARGRRRAFRRDRRARGGVSGGGSMTMRASPRVTDADRARFLEQGFIAVADVVPPDYCERVIEATCAFIGVDHRDPNAFSRYPKQGHGIVPMHHAQALWDVRQLPAVHEVFSALYGTEKLWVSQDRVSFKIPSRLLPDGFRMDPVHWDGD